MKDTRTIKIWTSTYRKLKRLAAHKPEKMVELVNRLVDQELERHQPAAPKDG